MRILHTADWHLGKIVNEFSMLDLQREYLKKLVKKVDELKVDVLIMAGDLYDRAIPPKEAVSLANEVFTKLTQELDVPVLVIAGNHDSNERIEYGASLLSASQLYIEGTTKEQVRKVKIQNTNFYLIPYDDYRNIRQILDVDHIKTPEDALRLQLDEIKKDWDSEAVNILLYHGFIINIKSDADLEESESERPLSVGTIDFVSHELVEDFDYVALGHLHKSQKVSTERIRYSGSPLKYSKSEANYRKQNLIVDITKDYLEITPLEIPLSKDLRIIRGMFEEIKKKQSSDYIFFELEDSSYIIDAMNKLRKNYPYAMGLEYINHKEHVQHNLHHSKEKIKETSLKELFSDFYKQNIGLPLNEKQKEAVLRSLEEAQKKENI